MAVSAAKRDEAFAFYKARFRHHRKTKGWFRARHAAWADGKEKYGSIWAELFAAILPMLLKWLTEMFDKE